MDNDGDQIMSGSTGMIKSKSTGPGMQSEYDPAKSNLLLETFALEI